MSVERKGGLEISAKDDGYGKRKGRGARRYAVSEGREEGEVNFRFNCVLSSFCSYLHSCSFHSFSYDTRTHIHSHIYTYMHTRARTNAQINHFPHSFQLGRKDCLWRSVSHMQVAPYSPTLPLPSFYFSIVSLSLSIYRSISFVRPLTPPAVHPYVHINPSFNHLYSLAGPGSLWQRNVWICS